MSITTTHSLSASLNPYTSFQAVDTSYRNTPVIKSLSSDQGKKWPETKNEIITKWAKIKSLAEDIKKAIPVVIGEMKKVIPEHEQYQYRFDNYKPVSFQEAKQVARKYLKEEHFEPVLRLLRQQEEIIQEIYSCVPEKKGKISFYSSADSFKELIQEQLWTAAATIIKAGKANFSIQEIKSLFSNRLSKMERAVQRALHSAERYYANTERTSQINQKLLHFSKV